MLVDFVVSCPSKKSFVRFVLGNRWVERNAKTEQTLKHMPGKNKETLSLDTNKKLKSLLSKGFAKATLSTRIIKKLKF